MPNPIWLVGLLIALVPFAALGTCIFIVLRTGSTDGLRDLAEVVRAMMRRSGRGG